MAVSTSLKWKKSKELFYDNFIKKSFYWDLYLVSTFCWPINIYICKLTIWSLNTENLILWYWKVTWRTNGFHICLGENFHGMELSRILPKGLWTFLFTIFKSLWPILGFGNQTLEECLFFMPSLAFKESFCRSWKDVDLYIIYMLTNI